MFDPLLLTGIEKHYPWGSRSFIQDLLGRTNDGPIAELWFGTHPRGPAWVPSQNRDLQELTRDTEGMSQLPFLVKFLAADRPLSIQCHPDKIQAKAGYEREQAEGLSVTAKNRLYPDSSDKPEILIALTPFQALKGFRSSDETQDLFRKWAPKAWKDISSDGATQTQESILRKLLNSDRPYTAEIEQSTPKDPIADWLHELSQHYPNDPLQLAPLLLNYLDLQPGQAIFLPAKEPHAYLKGAGVEVMASSDNVLRCGLTQKHVDKDEMLSVIDFGPHSKKLVSTDKTDNGVLYRAPTDAFSVGSLILNQSATSIPQYPNTSLLLCSSGTAKLKTSKEQIIVHQGQAALLPALLKASISGPATTWLVTSGK